MSRRWMHTVRDGEVHSEIIDLEDMVGLIDDGWFLTIPEAAATINKDRADDGAIHMDTVKNLDPKIIEATAATISDKEIVDPDATEEVVSQESEPSDKDLEKMEADLKELEEAARAQISAMTKTELIELAKEGDIKINTQDRKSVIAEAILASGLDG